MATRVLRDSTTVATESDEGVVRLAADGNTTAGRAVQGTDTRLNAAATVHAATGKTTPVDADETLLVDSAASNVLKKLTWANLKATLKTYFDTLYAAVSHNHTAANVSDFAEAVDDRVAALLVEGAGIDLTYNDGANTLTIAATGGGGGAGTVVVQEVDGTPSNDFDTIIFPNGTLTDNADGSVTYTPAGGGGHSQATQSDWTAPTFANSWVNYDNTGATFETAAYMKDAQGFVHLRGLIKSGTLNGTAHAFTLPSGYRPARSKIFVAMSADTANPSRCDILPDGKVVPYSGSNTFFSLDGITFSVNDTTNPDV